jgi:transmembrane sensor
MLENTEDLINIFIEGKIADEDLKIIIEELKKNPGKRKLLDEFIDIWQATLKAGNTDDYNAEMAWQNLKCKIRNTTGHTGQSTSYQLLRRIQQVAAAVIIMVILGTLAFSLHKKGKSSVNPVALSEYIIPYGSRSQVILPDGTSIWLNSGSKIKYDGQFGHNNRNIFLEGEAYFDVTRNEKLPFVVSTAGLSIKVLGTAFNVKAYPDENYIETTVERGVVQVTGIKKNSAKVDRIVLKANQKLLYARNDEIKKSNEHNGNTARGLIQDKKSKAAVLDDNVSTKIYTSWKDNRWIIEREELQSLAVKLERRYNVSIVISDESLKSYVFSGILEDETLEQVLEAIKLTAPIHYKINQKQVFLSRNIYFKPN